MSGWVLVAAAGAVWLLVPPRAALPDRGTDRRPVPAWVAVVVPVAVVAWVDRSAVVLAAVGAAALLAGLRLWRGRVLAARVAAHRRSVVELCDVLRVELGAGQAPSDALALATHDWRELAAAARTAASGGDVPQALRQLATLPGAGDLRVVAAAWQVAHRTGHGLADALGRVADELRAAEQTRRIVAGELASARATARLVAALPVAALLLGTGAGSDPWGFLLHQPLGWACLAGGVGFGIAGLSWIEALAADVERAR